MTFPVESKTSSLSVSCFYDLTHFHRRQEVGVGQTFVSFIHLFVLLKYQCWLLSDREFSDLTTKRGLFEGVCVAAAALWRSAILCVLNTFFFSLMQRSTVMVNICIAFFFSRLRLSERVQGADTVSFQAVAPHSDVALKSGPLSRLLCIPGTLRSNLIWFKGPENMSLKKKKPQSLSTAAFVSPRPSATSFMKGGSCAKGMAKFLKCGHELFKKIKQKNWVNHPVLNQALLHQYAPAGRCVWRINRFFPVFHFNPYPWTA